MTANEESKRSWISLEFVTLAINEDLASWLMMQCGAKGCQVSPEGDAEIKLSCTFEPQDLNDKQLEDLKSSLEMYGLAACLKTLMLRKIPEEDWLAEWKKGFQPFAVGERFLICPPWLVEDLDQKLLETADGQRHLILIEPGMAFGTGLHATTQYCLRALEKLTDVESFADVGTGSGILAIAAAKLNPDASIVAVDTDPAAIRVAQENLDLNEVSNVELVEGSTEVLDAQAFDCILSNLTAEDNQALMIDYLRLLRPGGTIICAGILAEKLKLIEKAIETYPLVIAETEPEGMWVGVKLERVAVVVKGPS